MCSHCESSVLLFTFKDTVFVCMSGAEGFTTQEDQELLSRVEKQIKRRFVVGSQVSEHAIVQDFTRQVCLGDVLSSVDCW